MVKSFFGDNCAAYGPIFSARCETIARTSCRKMYVRLSVCPPVRLSVTHRCCVETAKHIIKLFSISGSHTILVFLYQTLWQYSDGTP